jgi:restriction system protein
MALEPDFHLQLWGYPRQTRVNPVTLPSYTHFIGPLLEHLVEQSGPVRPREVYSELADKLALSEVDRNELLPSGRQRTFHNRIGWAHDALKRAGLSSAPARGSWQITDAGKELLHQHQGRIPAEEMERIGGMARDVSLRLLEHQAEPQVDAPHEQEVETQSPREQIDRAVQQLRASLASDLLDYIGRQTPDEFEVLVLDLLFALGYGTSRESLHKVGKSGDGGIDGIVPLDRLGLQKVYVQAKKWQGQVGSPQIQGFMGALHLQGADKGVLITSGSISGPAREAARQARGTLVLIDGVRLAELMIDHGVGVSHESLRLPKLDIDYFEAS